MRALVWIPAGLAGASWGNGSYAEHCAAVLREAGLTAVTGEPLDGPTLVWDARYPRISADSLREVAETGRSITGPRGSAVVWAKTATTATAALTEVVQPLLIDDGELVYATDAVELLHAERGVLRERVYALIRSGVRIVDPERVWIDATVTLAAGAKIAADVSLYGTCDIGAASIGQGSILTDTVVADGAIVKPYTVCEGANIGPKAQVGPFAHLRPKAVLSADVKVGNFVEVKNTLLHEGAKASHLTYLGDAEVGADANIGAGTITCNYDGYRKQHTFIGAKAFIGSNSALIAPIRIGNGAIIGAGSVISRDVPDDALAVERSDQRTLEGRARMLNEKNRRAAGK